MKKMSNVVAISAAAIVCLCLSLGAGAQEKKTVQIEGSTTVGPIAEAFAKAYEAQHPEVKITVNSPGSGIGATALIEGRAQIATMSRFMKPDEFKKAVEKGIMPVAHAIAMDGVCVIVHPSNPIKNISREDLRGIYTGKITNWKQLGGPDKAIVAMGRETSSGTYEVFEEKVMNKEKIGQKVETVSSNPQMQTRVTQTEGGIGYVGLAFTDGVKALTVDRVGANRKTIIAGTYPIARPLYLFTNGYPALGGDIYNFCTIYLGEKGQEIIEAKGFVPFTSY